jgi:Lon protease-like protein
LTHPENGNPPTTEYRHARDSRLRERLEPYLERLPIFPLYRVQLFPSSLLPLYVFEPRYREMTAACLEGGGGGFMAVASLRPGFREQYEGRPPVRRTAGVGKIVAHRKNPDGTYNILLRGLGRVRIIEELPPERSFREVRARLVRDRWPLSFDLSSARDAVRVLVERLAGLLAQIERSSPPGPPGSSGPSGDGAGALRALLEGEPPSPPGQPGRRVPGRFFDTLTAALVRDPRARQKLLETADLSRRADLLSGELARLVAHLARLGGVAGQN